MELEFCSTYCPLCTPEILIIELSNDIEYVIVRFYPACVMDIDNMEISTFDAETGLHIIYKGWFNNSEKTEDNMLIWQVCHPLDDWRKKHMLNADKLFFDLKKLEKIVKENA